MAKEPKYDGYPLGDRTKRPHSPDGWSPRRDGEGTNEPAPRRGVPPASGEHDRPSK